MNIKKLLPILLCFFAMGFVDLVGIATNYVKADLSLTDTAANIFPSLVFFWFLIFSVPTGMLMNKIGRKNTVLISLLITIASLIVPLFSVSYAAMLISFSLLGIGNAVMQTSLNPLVSNVISGDKLASSLTLGQFVKAIASFVAPIIAAWGALKFGYWRILFPIFAVIGVLALLALWRTRIDEEPAKGKASTLTQCLGLLGNGSILLLFFGIMCHVGIDVGTNVTAPKLLMERAGFSLTDAGFATSLYFIFRTMGCFAGTFILARTSARKFFTISMVAMTAGMVGLFFATAPIAIYVCVALIGFGNSNVFPILLSQAMQNLPEKKNEVSGLMIMGLFGGTVFPLLMGIASDGIGTQIGAVMVMMVGVVYLAVMATKIKG